MTSFDSDRQKDNPLCRRDQHAGAQRRPRPIRGIPPAPPCRSSRRAAADRAALQCHPARRCHERSTRCCVDASASAGTQRCSTCGLTYTGGNCETCRGAVTHAARRQREHIFNAASVCLGVLQASQTVPVTRPAAMSNRSSISTRQTSGGGATVVVRQN